ncbi:hypothetical protein GGX14DRAFT_580265 [Mycena pura]|uniref:Uncharacterized protein n=1 Tax=Mycena pura TaxID=153505 RepID=A0AAD6ULU7_9AGAR|nr:hypothetical protein GGX14DRAFT_580265 [Mycena pura]
MPFLVPDDLAAAFLASLSDQNSSLPPAIVDLQVLFRSPHATAQRTVPVAQTPAISRLARPLGLPGGSSSTQPPPAPPAAARRRARLTQRAQSEPVDITEGPEDFVATLASLREFSLEPRQTSISTAPGLQPLNPSTPLGRSTSSASSAFIAVGSSGSPALDSNMAPFTPAHLIEPSAITPSSTTPSSSPTLHGPSPLGSSFSPSLFSPLDKNFGTLNFDFIRQGPPSLLSPLSPASSASSHNHAPIEDNDELGSVLGKRTTSRGPAEDSEDDNPPPRLTIVIPSVQSRLARALADQARRDRAAGIAGGGGGDGGGGGGGGRGGPPAHMWTEDCVRRGDRARVSGDASIGMMPCGESTCHSCSGGADEGGEGEGEGEQDDSPAQPNNSQKGQRKRKKADVGWREEPQGGLVVTKRAGELLSDLLTVYNRANREHLDVLLAGLDPASLSMESGSSLATVVNRLVCAAEDDVSEVVKVLVKQDAELRLKELHRMVTLVQLALHVDSLRADAVLKHSTPPTYESLAKQYAGTTPTGTFRDWLSHGKRLLFLCAAGSCYILPIIAALDLRTIFTRKTTLEPDIRSLATALREVKHGLWLPMVRRLMVPMYHINASPGQLKSLEFVYNVPKAQGQSPERLSFGFSDIESSDRVFDSVETQFPQLPTRSKEWNFSNLPSWKPLQNPQLVVLPPVHTIRTPLQYKRTRCPVTKVNRNTFTDVQRGFGEQAEVAENLEDLEVKLTNIHATGALQATYIRPLLGALSPLELRAYEGVILSGQPSWNGLSQ